MKPFRIVLLIIFHVLSLAYTQAAEPQSLVDDGEPNAVIVHSAEPSAAAVLGANILSDHIFQISGARLETIAEAQVAGGESRTRILVGESKSTAALGASAKGLGPGGILIRTYPAERAIVILGADGHAPVDSNGTRYAVTTFLENALGVRFLWPGELGKVVPKRQSIEVAAMEIRKTPLLTQRRIRMAGGWGDRMAQGGEKLGVDGDDFEEFRKGAAATESQDAGWAGWHRLGGSLRLASGHSFGDYWERFGESHPEWFAMAPNGSRDQSASVHRARLCVSNEDLIEQVAKDRIVLIDKTGQKSVAIGPNDGGTTSFCVCDKCEALDAPSDRKITMIDFSPGQNRRQFEHVPLTDRYVHFFNAVAEKVTAKHPEVWLGADAYSLYSAPPVKAKLHPNIAIRYVGISYTNEEKRHQGVEDWNAWSQAASKIYFRSNLLLAGRRQGTLVAYIHKLAEDFGQIAHNNMIGTDLDSCCHNWATQGLNYYVMAKLLWNPDLDIDALLDDYCHSGFGAGGDAVKRYFLRVEELTHQMATSEMLYAGPYTPEVITELTGLLDEAAAATKNDAGSAARVAFLQVGLDYTDGYCSIFRTNDEWQSQGGGRLTPEIRERFRGPLERNWENSRNIFENHHFAVNVANVAWGSWGYFPRYGWKGASGELLEKWKRD